jgi:hypothetical protein
MVLGGSAVDVVDGPRFDFTNVVVCLFAGMVRRLGCLIRRLAPSTSDITFTQRTCESGKTLDMDLPCRLDL